MTKLIDVLKQCIAPDDGLVVVHSSIPHLLPPPDIGASDFLAAFQQLVSEGHTFAFPAFTFTFCRDGRYHARESLPETGILARWALAIDGALRTPHPIYSFVVVGPLAAEFAAARNTTTFGADSSFALCETLNARLMMMGCDWSQCSQLHRYEEEARVPYRYVKQFSGTAAYHGDEAEPVAVSMFVRDLDIDPEIIAEPAVVRLRQEKKIRRTELWKGAVESVDCVSFAAACRAVLSADPWALAAVSRGAMARAPSATDDAGVDTAVRGYLTDRGLGRGVDAEQPLDLDSYAIVQLIIHLEQTFGIDVHAADIVPEHFETVASITRFVDAKRQP
jgi:aminoglycoside N3'-acetyltransferase